MSRTIRNETTDDRAAARAHARAGAELLDDLAGLDDDEAASYLRSVVAQGDEAGFSHLYLVAAEVALEDRAQVAA